MSLSAPHPHPSRDPAGRDAEKSGFLIGLLCVVLGVFLPIVAVMTEVLVVSDMIDERGYGPSPFLVFFTCIPASLAAICLGIVLLVRAQVGTWGTAAMFPRTLAVLGGILLAAVVIEVVKGFANGASGRDYVVALLPLYSVAVLLALVELSPAIWLAIRRRGVPSSPTK